MSRSKRRREQSPMVESLTGEKLAGKWEFAEEFMIPVKSLIGSEWRSKVGLLPTLDQIKQTATGIAALCDVLYFQFVDEFNKTIAPTLDEVRRRMEFATSPVREYEEYSYWEYNKVLIRHDTSKRYFSKAVSAWEFFDKECSTVESIPLTKDGIMQMFSDIVQPDKVIQYKTDAYTHYNTGAPWDIEDFINPLSLLDPMFGINTNMVLIAPPGAVSSFHLEEVRLASYNVIWVGLKVWYFIIDPEGKKTPNQMAKLLADTIRDKLAGSGVKFTGCANFMSSKTFATNPDFFEGTGIQVVTVTQRPGQIIYTGVDTFHMVVTIQPTISVAFNVIPVRKDDGRSFVPQSSNVCMSGHGPSGGDIHNGCSSRGVMDSIAVGGGVMKLIEFYQAAMESNRIQGYRLNGLYHFSENINGLSKREQLQMAYSHNRYVWSNLTNSTKTPGVFRIVELCLDEDYVVLSTYSEKKDSLVIRPISNVEIYPDLFNLMISGEKTIRVSRRLVVGLDQRPHTDLFRDCPLSIVQHGVVGGGSSDIDSGYEHRDDDVRSIWGSSDSSFDGMPVLLPPANAPHSTLHSTPVSVPISTPMRLLSSGTNSGTQSSGQGCDESVDGDVTPAAPPLSPRPPVFGSIGPSSSFSGGDGVGDHVDISNPGHHDNACKVRVTGFKGICSQEGLRKIFSGIGRVVGVILYGRQKEHALIIFSDPSIASFAVRIAGSDGICCGSARLEVSSYVRRNDEGRKVFQRNNKRKSSRSRRGDQFQDEAVVSVPFQPSLAPCARRRGSGGGTNVFIVNAGGHLTFTNN